MIRILKSNIDLKKLLFFITIFITAFVITYRTHSGKGYYNWQSEIWADRAGYYIYLPAFFMYHFDAKKAPEKIEEKTGYGFTIDSEKNTINTKYTYGVSVLLSPFFLIARLVSPLLHQPGEAGFGPVFHKMVNVAAVFYFVLGLWFLEKFLAFYFKPRIRYLVLFFLAAGTNLLYYATDDTLMSHIYSFFLFSVFLYSMKKVIMDRNHFRSFLLFSVSFALIILIRPTNVVMFLLFLCWDINSFNEIRTRIVHLFRPRYLITLLLVTFMVFLPQMIYWKYSRGGFLVYSYGTESFSNWSHPRIAEVWFSTLNGLFLYNPLFIMMIAGMILMMVRKQVNGWITFGLFLTISYLFASWYNWYFGCSFGQRSYVEYYALFAIPFGFLIKDATAIKNLFLKALPFILILFFSYYNIKLIHKFDKCFFGSSWDWSEFSRQLDRAGIFIPYQKSHSFTNDMENQALSYPYALSDSVVHTGMYSAKVNPDKVFLPFFSVPVNDLGERLPHYIQLGLWAYTRETGKNESLIVCSMEKNDSAYAWQSQLLAPYFTRLNQWQKINVRFVIPEGVNRDLMIKLYLWNPKGSTFYIDDLKLQFN
ncbi:MAG: hypothetical protein WCL00_01220 [Bacteroidota bacterium]